MFSSVLTWLTKHHMSQNKIIRHLRLSVIFLSHLTSLLSLLEISSKYLLVSVQVSSVNPLTLISTLKNFLISNSISIHLKNSQFLMSGARTRSSFFLQVSLSVAWRIPSLPSLPRLSWSEIKVLSPLQFMKSLTAGLEIS